MIRLFTKLILVLFVFAAGSVALLLITGESREAVVQRNKADAAGTANITGHFIQHLMLERMDKLRKVALSGDTQNILKSLVGYTDYVGGTYGHRGAFMIGLMDSGFGVTGSFNSSRNVCSTENIIDEDIAKRLLSGESYAGPAPEECISEYGSDSGLILFAVPVMDKDGFYGLVYEVSSLISYVESYRGDQIKGVDARIIMDDPSYYPPGSENHSLLSIRDSLANEKAGMYMNRVVGFRSFYVDNTKLCLVYIKTIVNKTFDLECCPWLEDYKGVILLSPLVLLILWVMMEMARVNGHLGSEVKQRTAGLESLRLRYEGIFRTIPEYVVIYKRDGEILECNERFAGLLKGGNPVGANLIYMVRERERFRQMTEALEADGQTSFSEFLLTGREEQVYVSVNSCMLEIDGERAFLSIMTDLTDYKRIQNTYYMAQKKEVVGTLAAGMVHDFSNILQNISLQYSLLERSEESQRPNHMQNIKNILEGANSYLAGVLSYTKGEQDRSVMKKGRDFVDESIEMLERVLPADIEIRYEDTSGGLKIKAVQAKITQIMINLCQNASDAMKGKGIIYITTGMSEKVYGRFFCIRVKDSGEGIAPEHIEKIYKPFFTTKEGKGTGLGLATVKQVVVELGGFIEVESEPGKGTEFTIMLSEIK